MQSTNWSATIQQQHLQQQSGLSASLVENKSDKEQDKYAIGCNSSTTNNSITNSSTTSSSNSPQVQPSSQDPSSNSSTPKPPKKRYLETLEISDVKGTTKHIFTHYFSYTSIVFCHVHMIYILFIFFTTFFMQSSPFLPSAMFLGVHFESFYIYTHTYSPTLPLLCVQKKHQYMCTINILGYTLCMCVCVYLFIYIYIVH